MSAKTVVDAPAVDQTTTRPKRLEVERPRTRPRRQPPYAVIVENDDKHTFEYVLEVLQRVCGHNETQAFVLTKQIHVSGRAPVWSGTLELAELKRDQIRGYGPDHYDTPPVTFPLGVTLEPLPSD